MVCLADAEPASRCGGRERGSGQPHVAGGADLPHDRRLAGSIRLDECGGDELLAQGDLNTFVRGTELALEQIHRVLDICGPSLAKETRNERHDLLARADA